MQRVPYRINPRRNRPGDILNKLIKTKQKERILKAARDKQKVTYKGSPVCLIAYLSSETLQARREWQDIMKVLKGKNIQPRLLYPAKNHPKLEGKKNISDKQKVREFSTTEPALQQILKGHIYSQEINRRKRSSKNPKTIKKITIRTYISIIT